MEYEQQGKNQNKTRRFGRIKPTKVFKTPNNCRFSSLFSLFSELRGEVMKFCGTTFDFFESC